MWIESNDRMSESVESGSKIILQQWNQMMQSQDAAAVDMGLDATWEMVEAMVSEGIEAKMSAPMAKQYERLASLSVTMSPEEFSQDYEEIMDRLCDMMFDTWSGSKWSLADDIALAQWHEPYENKPKDRQLLRQYLIYGIDTDLFGLPPIGLEIARNPRQVLVSYVFYPALEWLMNSTFGWDKEDVEYRNTREQHIKYYNEYKYALLSLDNDDVDDELFGDEYREAFKEVDRQSFGTPSSKSKSKVRKAKKLYDAKLGRLSAVYKERNKEFIESNPINNAKLSRQSFGDRIKSAMTPQLSESCTQRLEAVMKHERVFWTKWVTFQDLIRDKTNNGYEDEYLLAMKKMLSYYVGESIIYANSGEIREFRKKQAAGFMKKLGIAGFSDKLADEWDISDMSTIEELSVWVFGIEFTGVESSADAWGPEDDEDE